MGPGNKEFKACGVLDDSAKFSVVNLGVLF